ncbi:MAG: hypothetical protein A3D92_18030 [Bacteroidetes bacterium RIFCSPHIGHO2_02_FULL_44_7]|nr:MAG: hypothetical protein A3D92_18030 [Bacteroidetes bacterium RIFCSPHIGHO2_02_FULL_44_7]
MGNVRAGVHKRKAKKSCQTAILGTRKMMIVNDKSQPNIAGHFFHVFEKMYTEKGIFPFQREQKKYPFFTVSQIKNTKNCK